MKLDKYEIGKRYGKALFDLAVEQGNAKEIYQQLQTIQEVYAATPKLQACLSSAQLSAEDKNQMMQPLVAQTEGIVTSFLEVVQSHQRWAEVPEMIADFANRLAEAQHIITGKVWSILPLSKEQLEKIEKETAQILGYEHAHLENVIDTSIIGGIKIEANHYVIDRTLQKRIQMMSKALMLEA